MAPKASCSSSIRRGVVLGVWGQPGLVGTLRWQICALTNAHECDERESIRSAMSKLTTVEATGGGTHRT